MENMEAATEALHLHCIILFGMISGFMKGTELYSGAKWPQGLEPERTGCGEVAEIGAL